MGAINKRVRGGAHRAVTLLLGAAASTCSGSSSPPAIESQRPDPAPIASSSFPPPAAATTQPSRQTAATLPGSASQLSSHEINVASRVRKLIAERLSVDAARVTDDARLVEDLNADSLDSVEIVMALEEEFGIEIPDQEAEKFLRVRDVVAYVAKQTVNR
jgi:acyl carrier protein